MKLTRLDSGRVQWGQAPPQSPALAEVDEKHAHQLAVRREEGVARERLPTGPGQGARGPIDQKDR
eukprot:5152207-Alexandrium_andersonii.AAC.1